MPELELHTLNTQAAATPHALIAKAEIAYTAAMRYVALQCIAQGDRIVLLAGPSGSGKTTTAGFLARELTSRGYPARVISLDDFYRSPDDPDYPCLPDGRHDYECVESLMIDRIHDAIAAIQTGRDIMLPRFDFQRGCSIPEASLLHPAENGIVIFEGLHALNPILTEGLPTTGVYRLFISVSTNINVNGTRILSGRKMRFIRRLVREHLTPREREIITARYGLGGKVPRTQREIATAMGISRSYVSRRRYCKRREKEI
jgi:uridine kinase